MNPVPFKSPTQSLNLIFLICLAYIFFITVPVYAENTSKSKQNRWDFLTGYGSSYPGWGETQTRVETVDMLLRYNRVIIDDLGTSWFKGYHSLLIEPVIHFLINPDESPMVSLNFLACHTFTTFKPVSPYIFGGGGPVYVGSDIDGVGARWNGNYQFGVGIRWQAHSDRSFLFEIRYHHVSNGNRKEPNVPLNSTKFLFGFTF